MTRRFNPNAGGLGSGQRKRLSMKKRWTLEAEETACAGDFASAALLLVAIQQSGDKGFMRQARNLILKLQAAAEGDPDANSLASKVAMRKVRKLWVRHVCKLVRMSRGYPVSFGTLLPVSLELTDADFGAFDAEAAKRAFKSYLNRRGISKRKGWLIATLHGEYDSIRNQWRLHWHVLGCHEMIKVIDALRTESEFKSIKGDRPRVRLTRKPLVNIPRVASYLLQAWWPNRPTGKYADVPEFSRTDHRMGLDDPQKVRWLLWFGQRKISDLVMLVGLRRTTSGFKMTKL